TGAASSKGQRYTPNSRACYPERRTAGNRERQRAGNGGFLLSRPVGRDQLKSKEGAHLATRVTPGSPVARWLGFHGNAHLGPLPHWPFVLWRSLLRQCA